jgi:Rrf2 family protein
MAMRMGCSFNSDIRCPGQFYHLGQSLSWLPMKLSQGVEWGLHCCVVLGQATAPVPAARLAVYHGVSQTYLAKHLQALARAGLVRSTQGQVGGYELTREPGAITVLDVVSAIDGDAPAFRCTEIRQRGPLGTPPERCLRPCAIARAMAAAEHAWREALRAVTIADLTEDVQEDTDGAAMPRLREWLAP